MPLPQVSSTSIGFSLSLWCPRSATIILRNRKRCSVKGLRATVIPFLMKAAKAACFYAAILIIPARADAPSVRSYAGMLAVLGDNPPPSDIS